MLNKLEYIRKSGPHGGVMILVRKDLTVIPAPDIVTQALLNLGFPMLSDCGLGMGLSSNNTHKKTGIVMTKQDNSGLHIIPGNVIKEPHEPKPRPDKHTHRLEALVLIPSAVELG